MWQCLQSMSASIDHRRKNGEIVVIDMGSTDSTLSEIYSMHVSRIIPIHISTRHKAETLNIGLEYVLGEYVLELDGDDWIDPTSLENMVSEGFSYKDKYEKFQTHCPRLYRYSALKELDGWMSTIQGEPLQQMILPCSCV